MSLNPYLFFNGQCAEAFKFYEKTLGAKILMMITHGETPAKDHVAPEWHGKIVHARLALGDQLLMASDSQPDRTAPKSGFCVNISVDTPAEAERIFYTLAEGGKVQMPIGETFWALRFGSCSDRFGTPWMVNCEKPM